MKGRLLLVPAVVAAALILVPAASAVTLSVGSASPNVGVGGDTVTLTISGTFYVDTLYQNVLAPAFTLTNGYTDIPGTTNSWTATSANATFALPQVGPESWYFIKVTQSHMLIVDPAYTTDTYRSPLPQFALYTRPAITSIAPSSVAVGSLDVTLVVYGQSFRDYSVVRFNGEDLVTIYNNAGLVTAGIPWAKFSSPGTAAISVWNRPKDQTFPFAGIGSNTVMLPIGKTVPTLAAINPTSVWAGSVRPNVVLTVTGTDFVSGASITLNGVARTSQFLSATQLTAPLTAADTATAGTIDVGVSDPPAPGSPSATTLPLTVQPETTTPQVTISGADGDWHNTPVTLRFAASDPQSGVQKLQYMAPPGVATWTDGSSYTVPTSTQGVVTVSAQAFDWTDKVGTAQVTVKIDTTPPDTATLGDASVKKGKQATLKYRIGEAAGSSPTADVVIQVKDGGGKTVKTITQSAVTVNTPRAATFTCKLKKGTYTWYVSATDLAGNQQDNVASARLTVK